MKPFEAYNPSKEYFGPQGHWSSPFIQQALQFVDIPGEVRPEFDEAVNYAAYLHDKAYYGRKSSGFLANIWNEWHRNRADKKLRDDIRAFSREWRDWLKPEHVKNIKICSDIVYAGLVAGGWKFYKTGKED